MTKLQRFNLKLIVFFCGGLRRDERGGELKKIVLVVKTFASIPQKTCPIELNVILGHKFGLLSVISSLIGGGNHHFFNVVKIKVVT